MRAQSIRPGRRDIPRNPRRRRLRTLLVTGGVLALLPLALPAAANPYQTINVSLASGPSPFASCDISGDVGTNYLDTEVEPWVAVDPNDANHLVAVWQQDRWNNGGARGLMTGVSHDGGVTWPVQTFAHFSKCSGGTPANGGDFDRASDPWVTFSPNGDVYQIALSISFVSATESAVLVSKSTDGGVTWSEPTTLARDDFTVGAQLFHDKESITADPLDSNFVYAVWDRSRFPSDQGKPFGGFPHSFRGDIMFARTTDGGQTWEQARPIFRPQANEASIGHIIAVIPDGTLVDIFDRLKGSGNNRPGFDIAVVRSTDRGVTWSSPLHVADELALGVRDPDTGFPVRAGVGLPDIAADLNPSSPGYGNLYAVWGDGFSKQATHDGIAFTMSTDGGLTWTPITRISKTDPSIDAFTPAIDVAADGTVGVAYYDFRNNTPDPGLPTDTWFVHCHADTDCTNQSNWEENHVAGPFDMEQAPVARGYFVGDYFGEASAGTTFYPFFSQTTDTDKANAYSATVVPGL